MITKDQYKIICDYLDNLLVRDDVGVEIFAIPWVHLIRAHPIVIIRYKEIFLSRTTFRYLIYFLKKNTQIYLNSIYLLSRALFSSNKYYLGEIGINSRIEYLFISHLLNNQQISDDKDFYFGNSANILRLHGHRSIIAFIPQFKLSKKFYHRKQFSDKIIFVDILPFKIELKIRIKLWKSFLKISKIRCSNNLEKIVNRRAALESLSLGAQNNLRLAEQLVEVLGKTLPKFVIFPFEGHGYERVIIHTIKTKFPQIKCIAYQHTGIFEYSNAIYKFYSNLYNPSMILTSGKDGLEKLKKVNPLIPIKVLGSNRGVSFSNYPFINNQRKKCIVIPEGFLSECKLLFEISYACALKMPDIDFIWRLHPSISFKEFFEFAPELKILPSNIILSSLDIEIDIKNCAWGLYRGSTAIFKIISTGARPIYLTVPDEISLDPLYDLKDEVSMKIFNFKELISILKKDISSDFSFQKRIKSYFVKYCRSKFSPINYEMLLPQNLIADNEFRG